MTLFSQDRTFPFGVMSKARIRGYRRSVKRSIIGQDFRLEDRTLLSTTPTLSSVTPDRGVLAGGTSITIVGTNFSSDPSQDVVTLGSVTATITSASATQLVVKTPAQTSLGYYSLNLTVGGSASSNS